MLSITIGLNKKILLFTNRKKQYSYLTKLLTNLIRMDLECEHASINCKKIQLVCSSHHTCAVNAVLDVKLVEDARNIRPPTLGKQAGYSITPCLNPPDDIRRTAR